MRPEASERFRESHKTLLANRLQEALEHQDRSIRSLQQELKERGAKYTSYTAVHSYVTGQKMPPMSFLLETAAALGLRQEWMLLGKGEPTEEEEIARAEPSEEVLDLLSGTYPAFDQLPDRAQRLFVDVLGDFALTASDVGDAAEDEQDYLSSLQDLAGDLLWLLLLPVSEDTGPGESWGFKRFPEGMSERELSQYAVAMLHALQCGMANRGESGPIEEAGESRLRQLRRTHGNL